MAKEKGTEKQKDPSRLPLTSHLNTWLLLPSTKVHKSSSFSQGLKFSNAEVEKDVEDLKLDSLIENVL